MTPDQFNDKWASFLEEGHYGLAIGSDAVTEFLDKEVMPVLTQIEGFTFSQIKTKFSNVCFYTSLSWWMTSGIEEKISRILNEDPACTNRHFND